MSDIIEKTLLAGIGALALSQQKAEELIEEMQRQFNLSEEKGREMLSAIRQSVGNQQQKLEEIAQKEVQRTCSRMGLVTREEFDILQKKVETLENHLFKRDSE